MEQQQVDLSDLFYDLVRETVREETGEETVFTVGTAMPQDELREYVFAASLRLFAGLANAHAHGLFDMDTLIEHFMNDPEAEWNNGILPCINIATEMVELLVPPVATPPTRKDFPIAA